MADKVAVYYKNIRKNFPGTGKLQGFVCKMLNFTDSWITDIILVTSQWCYSCITYSIAKPMWFPTLLFQDSVQDGSRQVLQTCGSGTLPVSMSDGFVTDQIPCLINKHFTSTRIWINEPIMHVWQSYIVQAGISESGTGSAGTSCKNSTRLVTILLTLTHNL